jgi:prepilin-type N-terminal cleavage/methylation domain-containing protein
MNFFNHESRPFCRRAFTLIEIMVAVAIFAILVAAVYSTWVLILKASQVGQEAAAQVQRERIAIRTLEDSLTCIQSFQASMQYYVFNVTNGEQASLSFVARLPDVFPRNGRFDSNLRRLTFSVEPAAGSVPGSDAEKDLMLRQNPILMDMDEVEQATPLMLAKNVKSFVVECWDTNALDWATEWDDTNSLPPMVRVTLTLGGNTTSKSSANVIAITREIAVPSATLPSIIQNGSLNAAAGGGGGGNGQNGNGRSGNNPAISPGRDNRNNGGGGLGGPTLQPAPNSSLPAIP